jgi:hypothetical protein
MTAVQVYAANTFFDRENMLEKSRTELKAKQFGDTNMWDSLVQSILWNK